MLSRRDLIAKAAVGAAAAMAVGGVVGTAVAATRPLRAPTGGSGAPTDDPADKHDALSASAPQVDDAPAPWALVAPFGAGAEVAYGWRLADLTPIRDGSAVAT